MNTAKGTTMWELINAGKMEEYAAAKKAALARGLFAEDGTSISVLLEQGEADFWRGAAVEELEDIFKNPDITSGNIKYGTPEFIRIDELVVALQRMQVDTSCENEGCSTFVHAAHGTSHLEQALGAEGADDLLRKMYANQRLAKKPKNAKWILAGIAILVIVAIVAVSWILS